MLQQDTTPPSAVASGSTEMSVIASLEELGSLGPDWDRLQALESRFFPDFWGLQRYLSEGQKQFRVFCVKTDGVVTCLACFVHEAGRKTYTIGERRLFTLPVRQARLIGSGVLGAVDPALFGQFVSTVSSAFAFHLLVFDDVLLDEPLHRAIEAQRNKFILTRPTRKDAIRWMIKLPRTFDEYLSSLSSKSRQNLKREMRKFETELKPELLVITRPEQIEPFLRDGEHISRQTYQWHVGQRLCNDAPTRERYVGRAARGQLRAHMVHVDGRPCAFSRGELVGGVFHYETPGYDPQYAKASPGTVLLALVIKDLIENTNCETFDFGSGGDEVGYKSRFGNTSSPSRALQLSPRFNPYALMIVLVQEGLTFLKNLASKVLGDGALRVRLRKALRKYGT
jgi:hypothetical protein